MVMGNKALVVLHNLLWSLLFSWCNTCYGAESDIQCLKALKEQLNDRDNNLSSWIFSNETEGLICRFTGIECWIPEENRVRYIRLTNMGLQGQFPSALKNCKSLTGLDLSSNNLSGPIPHDIDELVPFVSVLDLSSNGFSGEIPVNLSNCTYLNVVNLTNNQLTGQIPWQLGQLNRLHKFTVAKNSLSGQIPYFLNSFPPQDFDNNLRLCGIPLNPCKINLRKSQTPVLIGSAVGGILFAALVVSVLLFCIFGVSEKKKEDVKGSRWDMTMKPTKGFKVR